MGDSAPGTSSSGEKASGDAVQGGYSGNVLTLDGAEFSNGAVGVRLSGGVAIRALVSQGCRPIGRPLLVTKADRNLVVELGRRPALEVFREVFGGGAAHLREKIVATASDRMVVIADQGKVVERLGQFHLPVEVIPFGWRATQTLITRALDRLEMTRRPILLRMRGDKPLLTDEGNYILDLALEAIPDAYDLAAELAAIAGVVEHGLFLNICQLAIIGRPDGSVVELRREDME